MKVKLVKAPIVAPIGQMGLMPDGLGAMLDWIKDRRPECLPENPRIQDIFPHSEVRSGNELLVEIAGRKCYNSFGAKAGRKTNAQYIAHTQQGDVQHRSILYHAKMTFFVAGISRRLTHELIRHYVGADRDEEGSPSQESTRYVEHTGHHVVHPRVLESGYETDCFKGRMEFVYASYANYIDREEKAYESVYGAKPKGLERKRIFEAASSMLCHSVETSLIWTANPVSIAKMLQERLHEAADLEWRRLAEIWRAVCMAHWPNLFPQPWML